MMLPGGPRLPRALTVSAGARRRVCHVFPPAYSPRAVSSLKDSYVGPYRLLNQLATGQSTEIWEAILDSSRRRVAIKRLQNVKRNRQQRAFLRHEYAVGAKLEHPRIIKIEELG